MSAKEQTDTPTPRTDAAIEYITDADTGEKIASVPPNACRRIETELSEASEELSACKTVPGGCGWWREAAKHRVQERDAARTELTALQADVRRLVEAAKILPHAIELLAEFSYESVEGDGKTEFTAHVSEDWFFHVKFQIEKLLEVANNPSLKPE